MAARKKTITKAKYIALKKLLEEAVEHQESRWDCEGLIEGLLDTDVDGMEDTIKGMAVAGVVTDQNVEDFLEMEGFKRAKNKSRTRRRSR